MTPPLPRRIADDWGADAGLYTYLDPDQFREALADGFSLHLSVVGDGAFRAQLIVRQVGRLTCWRGSLTPVTTHSAGPARHTSIVFLAEGAAPMLRNGTLIGPDEL